MFIRTLNHAILVSKKRPKSPKCSHANEGSMERHHLDERITCLLWLHDDFIDFFLRFDSFILNGWPNKKIEKIEH